jgi:hypothetical protein
LDSIHSVGGALDDVGFPEESRAAVRTSHIRK